MDVVRRESRRQARERFAAEMTAVNATSSDWTRIELLLDDAMESLNETDRAAVLLRYFENKPLREVGALLGASDDAAQKRVSRAVERLREFFSKRGVTASASGLVVLLSANAIQAAPAGLVAAISTTAAALAGTIVPTTTTATAIKTIAMTTLQKAIIGVTLAAAVGAGIYEARQNSKLRDQNESLQQQTAQLKTERESLSNQLARAGRSPAVSSERLRELLRLRGEVGVLRRQQRELEQTLAAAQSGGSASASRTSATASPPNAPAPFQVQLVADEPGENTVPMTNTTGNSFHVNKTPLMDYTAIRSVNVSQNGSSGLPAINIELSEEGKELFAAITKENLNKRLAIVMNGQLHEAPVIRSEITDGKAQITGNFTAEEAQALAAKINEAIRDQ